MDDRIDRRRPARPDHRGRGPDRDLACTAPKGTCWPAGPTDQRVIVRRVPRPAGEQPKLGEHPDWRYGAFTTNTTTGQLQWLDVRYRTQAHIEDKMKELKTCGADNLPSTDWHRNSAWLQLAALACTLNAWLRHLALDGPLAKAEPKALRYRLLGAPARHTVHAHRRTLLIPPGWAWAADLATGLGTTPSPPPHLSAQPADPTSDTPQAGPWNRRPPEHLGQVGSAHPHPAAPQRSPAKMIMKQDAAMNDQGRCRIPPGLAVIAGCTPATSLVAGRAVSPTCCPATGR